METIISEQQKFLEEFRQTHDNQTRTNGYMDFIEQAKVTSSKIMGQYNLQATINSVIRNTSICTDNLIQEVKQYGKNNRTPYVYKDHYQCTDYYLNLLGQCPNFPFLIEQAIKNGMIPIYNIGFPDAELATVIEEWMQAYLDSTHPDEKYTAQFILPEYQGSRENAIYKPKGIPHLFIQKRQKTK